MSSTGLEERAAGLAVLLSPLGLRQSDPFEPSGLTADLSWPATLALAELLSASRKEGAVTRDEADALLRDGGYDLAKFETQGWLRWILGRFEIPMGVGIAIAGLEAGRSPPRVSETELRAVAPLRKRIHAFADAQPIIDKAAAEAILSAYRDAPTLEKLAGEGAVRVNGGEVTLETRATLWSSRGDRIAAALWTKGPDANDLSRWIQRVPRDWWIAASVHLTEEQRGRLLDAMLAMVEDEPDLKDWPDEVSHIAPDVGDLGRELRRIDPPRASQLARYTWWKHLKIEGGRCRGRLACLVASIVRNDTEKGVNPYRRIRKLLSLTPRKAWLALAVPQGLLHSRPEVLASLVADPQDAVLAMSLLDSLSVPEGSWDSADERTQRQERYRTAVWRELLPLFVAGLAERGDSDPEAASSCVELLTYLLRRSTQGGFLMDPARRAIHDAEGRARLRILALELAKATLGRDGRARGERYLPRALPAIIASLLETVKAESDHARRITVLFWFFEITVDEILPHLAGTLAELIAKDFASWLNRTLDGDVLDAWFNDELGLAELAWPKVLLASRAATNQIVDAVDLHGKDVAAIANSVVRRDDADDDVDGFASYQIHSTLLRKRRLYLSILLHSLQRLPASSRVVVQPPALLEERLQKRLCSFLSADAIEEANVFSGTPYLHANSALLGQTLRAVDELPSEMRQLCLTNWILREEDPFLVLGILSETRSNGLRAVAEGKFALTDWEACFGEQVFWPTMFSMARLAIGAGKLDLADAILMKDPAPSPRDEQSFVPRLMLAAARGEAVDGIPVPRESSGDQQDVVDFFRGLLELATRPVEAAKTFEGLLRRGAHVAESAVNLFSARLRIAEEITDADARTSAIASALGDWTETAATLPRADRHRVAWDADQNELYALHVLGLHADFWRKWNELSRDERSNESFVQLAVAAGTNQKGSESQRVLEQAVQFHGSPVPAWLAQLRDESAAGKTPPVPLPRSAPLSDDEIRIALNEGMRRPIASRAVIFSSVAESDVDGFLLDLHLDAARELQRWEGMLGQIAEEDKLSDLMIGLLRAACRSMGISVHSQERGGLSGGDTRKTERGGVGERDWTVQANATEVAIVEALQLPNTDDVIQHHLKKLLERYDRAGLPRAFMLLYVRELDFDANVTVYQDAVRTWSSGEAPLIGSVDVYAQPAAYLRILRTVHARGDKAQTTVFHLLVRIPRDSRRTVSRT